MILYVTLMGFAMRVLRERGSSRLRASLRGVLPAVVTLAVLLAGRSLLTTVLPIGTGEIPLRETWVIRGCFTVLYLVMIRIAVRMAMYLDHRPFSDLGLTGSRRWLQDFAIGTGISTGGILVAIAWGTHRGFRAVDPTIDASGPGSPLYLGVAVIIFILFLLLGSIYEEIVYRGVMLQNFIEGLHARGLSRRWATGVGEIH